MQNEERRLHPIIILIKAGKLFKEIILPYLFIGIVNIVKAKSIASVGYWFFATIGLLGLLLLWGYLDWRRLTYTVAGASLIIKRGVLFRRLTIIPQERIQGIKLQAGILQRLFELVQVEVETAGGQKAEAVLAAVTKNEAARLQELLWENSNEHSKAEAEANTYKLPIGQLLIAGATSGRIGVVIGLAVTLLGQLQNFITDNDLQTEILAIFRLQPIFIILLSLLLIWLITIMETVYRYAGFTAIRNAKQILIRHGLLERRQIVLPIGRIQAIRIVEEWLRQPFGLVSIEVISAGYGTSKAEAVVCPLLHRQRLTGFLQQILPFPPEWPADWQRLPDRALRRYLFRTLLVAIIVAAGLSWLEFYGWAAVVIVIAGLWGWEQYRSAAYLIDGDLLYLRFRRLARTTVVIPRSALQWYALSQSPGQQRAGLTTIKFAVSAGSSGETFVLRDMELLAGQRWLAWCRDGK